MTYNSKQSINQSVTTSLFDGGVNKQLKIRYIMIQCTSIENRNYQEQMLNSLLRGTF